MPYPSSGVFGKVEEPFIADPGVGANLILLFDATAFIVNRVYELMWLRFRLVTSATVSVRSVAVEFRYQGALGFITTTVVTQAASLTYDYVAYPGITPSAALELNNRVKLSVPQGSLFKVDSALQPELRSNIVNLQAGDQISMPYAQFRVSQQ
jgi:hypothetical protein